MAKNDEFDLFAITPEMERYASLCEEHSTIDTSLYEKYDEKRGLRDINGKGVLTGLTEISDIQSSKVVDGKTVPCDGKLFYRGYDIEEIVADCGAAFRFSCSSDALPFAADEFRTRYHLEGSHKGYDVYAGPQRPDAVCIR